MKRILVLASLAALIAVAIGGATADAQQTQATPPQGNVEKGKESFKAHGCISCHGFSGWGGAGARLAQNQITFQAFVNYVRKPKGTMPPFGSQVTATELADIYAYVKSIPPSPDPKTIPLLNDK